MSGLIPIQNTTPEKTWFRQLRQENLKMKKRKRGRKKCTRLHQQSITPLQ
jgi:hypothetical protein